MPTGAQLLAAVVEGDRTLAPNPGVMAEDAPSVTALDWQPGQRPTGTSTRAAAPGFTWIDADRALPNEVIAVASQLDLPGYHPQFVRHLFSNIDPDDPQAPRLIDHFEPGPAAQLASGAVARLLQAEEPVFVSIEGPPRRRLSLVYCRLGFLSGNGWLLTYRARPFDVRFGGGYELPTIDREHLIAAASEYQRADQLPHDVAMLMLHHLARRALVVARELGDEIGNRMTDLHRETVEGTSADREGKRVSAELFDLRWALDAHERTTRRLVRGGDMQAERWYDAARDVVRANSTEELFERVLKDAREARRNLGEAMILAHQREQQPHA